MPCLSVYAEDHPQQPFKALGLPEHISATLAAIGVHYNRLEAARPLGYRPDDAELLAAYADQLQSVQESTGNRLLRVTRSNGCKDLHAAPHAHCLDEHSHDAVEVHLLLAGQVLVGLHADGQVFELLAEKGDLLVIPAGIRHWFDGGEPAD